ncbi:MAG TPA: alpha/beta hydrolase family protein [Blastocatellia bacterium]|nr:alpha/beta hydrolase family protein [Blastocatellia bacterium]
MPEKKIARRRFLKQSSVATMIAAAAPDPAIAFSACEPSANLPQSRYGGPLQNFDLPERHFDTVRFSLDLYEHHRPAMSFTATNRRSALLWQKRVRGKLLELIGGLPARRVALRPQILEKKEFPNYTREKVIFQSRENLSAFGYLLLPKAAPRPLPAVVCLPGHGRGCDDIVGIQEDGQQREAAGGYQRDFALQAVENGFAAFAIEQLAFGCRRDEAARKKGAGSSSCQPAAGAALLFGQTMIGWRVWDCMRAIDYLRARPEIDPQRVATMGISGGGTTSLFAAALDERIKVSVVSGYFNTFRDSIMSLSHCIDNYIPGILNYVEMHDIAGLIAPRGLFIESGTRDNIFPVEASRRAFAAARRIYTVFGAPERIEQEVFEGEHIFYGRGAFAFLKKWL